jgi:hypothetical protein
VPTMAPVPSEASGCVMAEPRDNLFGDAPLETVELWIRGVRTMDHEILEAFVRRTWRTWSATSLLPLKVAVDARRAELERGR